MALLTRVGLGRSIEQRYLSDSRAASSLVLIVTLAGLMFGGCGRLGAQDLVSAARPAVSSRQQLVEVLRRTAEAETFEWYLDVALIATWGEPVVSWVIDLVQDESVELSVRAAGMNVLYYSRPRAAVPVLRGLVERPGVHRALRTSALAALRSFPYPELAEFWRGLLRAGDRSAVALAISGLSVSGTEADIALIESVRGGRDVTEAQRSASVRLRLPLESRLTETFGEPPRADNRFVPSANWVNLMRPRLCARTRCPE